MDGTAGTVSAVITGILFCAVTTGVGVTLSETPFLECSSCFWPSIPNFAVPLSIPWNLVDSDLAKEEHFVSVPTKHLIVKSKLKKGVRKLLPY